MFYVLGIDVDSGIKKQKKQNQGKHQLKVTHSGRWNLVTLPVLENINYRYTHNQNEITNGFIMIIVIIVTCMPR